MRLPAHVHVLLLALTAAPATAGLDASDKEWIDAVQPLMLDEEVRLLESLKTKEDRQEFRKIFWARRDPDLLTPENEFKAVFDPRKAEADKRFHTSSVAPAPRSTDALGSQSRASTDIFANTTNAAEMAAKEEVELRQFREQRARDAVNGSHTDCGLTYIVLGPPDQNDKRTVTVWGDREPQAWTYRDKQTRILFDEACMMPVGNDKVRQQLKEYAIVQPTITYHIKGGELLKKLDDMMPKRTPMSDLLREARQDFSLQTQPVFLKGTKGTAVLGLVRGDGATLFREAAGNKTRVLLRAEGTPESGPSVVWEREVLADLDASGGFVASYRLELRPGPYTLRIAALDANSSKGSVITHQVAVPDFGGSELTIASLLALEGIDEGIKKDPRHPLSAFAVGDTRLRPRFGNVFHAQDELSLSYQFYVPDDAKAEATARLRILRADGSPIAEAPAETFATPVAGTVVGPVPLARYPPGRYRALLTVTHGGKQYTQDATFEVRAPDTADAAPR